MQVLQLWSCKTLEKVVDRCNIEENRHHFVSETDLKKDSFRAPLCLKNKEIAENKETLPLKFNKISSIKPKVKTMFTSLKGFHENKDDVRCCEIKSIAGLLPYITSAIPSKNWLTPPFDPYFISSVKPLKLYLLKKSCYKLRYDEDLEDWPIARWTELKTCRTQQ